MKKLALLSLLSLVLFGAQIGCKHEEPAAAPSETPAAPAAPAAPTQ